MTEIEQLRADIATLEAAEAVFARKYGQTYQRYNIELDMIRKQLAKLEEEAADPWRAARDSVSVYIVSNNGSIQLLAKYARHLEAQVVDLEEEVRCERIDGGKVHADLKARILAGTLRERKTIVITLDDIAALPHGEGKAVAITLWKRLQVVDKAFREMAAQFDYSGLKGVEMYESYIALVESSDKGA